MNRIYWPGCDPPWPVKKAIPKIMQVCRSQNNSFCRTSQRGCNAFTLIELLVVIAIIAIIAAILLPVLSKSKQSALNLTCLNNERQLQLCWHLYTVDNNDYLTPNNSVAFITPGTNVSTSNVKGVSWLPDVDCRTEINPSNIISGLLYQYNSSLGIYHCPSDTSRLQTDSGQIINQLRWRSYNMSQSMNGYPGFLPRVTQMDLRISSRCGTK